MSKQMNELRQAIDLARNVGGKRRIKDKCRSGTPRHDRASGYVFTPLRATFGQRYGKVRTFTIQRDGQVFCNDRPVYTEEDA